MTKKRATFGQVLREARLAKAITLRKFAQLVGISPTYLSQVEQGNCDPPTAARVQCMAELLGQNVDAWISLAGRVPDDLPIILQKQPAQLTAFLREVSDLTPDQLSLLSEQVRRLKSASAS